MRPGSTLDIAIWSTVEQGLAITAGSLATLRPLLFIAMHKLGLSTRNPSAYRPSAYGVSAPLPANGAASGINSKADKLRPDQYKLSATVQTRSSEEDNMHGGKSANWFGTGAPPNSKKSTRLDSADNESERSLRITSSRGSLEDAFQSGIMVSKSFYITDEERGSVVSAPYR